MATYRVTVTVSCASDADDLFSEEDLVQVEVKGGTQPRQLLNAAAGAADRALAAHPKTGEHDG